MREKRGTKQSQAAMIREYAVDGGPRPWKEARCDGGYKTEYKIEKDIG